MSDDKVKMIDQIETVEDLKESNIVEHLPERIFVREVNGALLAWGEDGGPFAGNSWPGLVVTGESRPDGDITSEPTEGVRMALILPNPTDLIKMVTGLLEHALTAESMESLVPIIYDLADKDAKVYSSSEVRYLELLERLGGVPDND